MDKPATTDLPLHELAKKRWSPRSFTDKSVDPKDLQTLLEAARWAPSAMNEQPWRLVVAQRGVGKGHEQLVACLAAGNQTWATQAPLLIAAVARNTYRHNNEPNPHAWHDTGQAVAWLTVQATALGLSVHQMGGFDADAVRSLYAIPDGFNPVSVVAVGYAGNPDALPEELAERERAPRKRLPGEQLFFAGTWENPLDVARTKGTGGGKT